MCLLLDTVTRVPLGPRSNPQSTATAHRTKPQHRQDGQQYMDKVDPGATVMAAYLTYLVLVHVFFATAVKNPPTPARKPSLSSLENEKKKYSS